LTLTQPVKSLPLNREIGPSSGRGSAGKTGVTASSDSTGTTNGPRNLELRLGNSSIGTPRFTAPLPSNHHLLQRIVSSRNSEQTQIASKSGITANLGVICKL